MAGLELGGILDVPVKVCGAWNQGRRALLANIANAFDVLTIVAVENIYIRFE